MRNADVYTSTPYTMAQVLNGMNDIQIAKLVEGLEELRYNDGSVITRQGQPGRGCAEGLCSRCSVLLFAFGAVWSSTSSCPRCSTSRPRGWAGRRRTCQLQVTS